MARLENVDLYPRPLPVAPLTEEEAAGIEARLQIKKEQQIRERLPLDEKLVELGVCFVLQGRLANLAEEEGW